MKRAFYVFVLLATPAVFMAAPAWAQTGSNIGLTQYPAPKCEKPQPVDEALRPRTPPENPSEDQANIYNSRLRSYNAAIRDNNSRVAIFNSCIQTYIANGNEDARRIREALDAAVAAVNAK